MLKIQIIIVLTLSKTIRVVAEISLVTLIPAKLKNAIEIIVPGKKIKLQNLWKVFCGFSVTLWVNL